jgi:hypothetical protein
MNFLTALGFREAHKNLEKSGNRLLRILNLIDWEPVRQILEKMYDNKSEKEENLAATYSYVQDSDTSTMVWFK